MAGGDDVLDINGMQVDAAMDDDVLEPARDRQTPFLDEAEISGAEEVQPFMPVEMDPERLLGDVRPIEVA